MKDVKQTRNARYGFALIIVIWMLILTSTSDYETELLEQQNWCDMVDQGFWGADPAEYQRRCGEQQ